MKQEEIPEHLKRFFRPVPGPKTLDLCLIPWRLAIALQDDGWLVRSVVVWHKPSAMPASLSGWMWRRCRVKVGQREKRKMPKDAGHAGRGSVSSGLHAPGWREETANGIPLASTEWSDCPGCKRCEKTNGLVLRRGSWRPTSSYEPILMLAKSDRYFSDGEAVKTPAAEATVSRDRYTRVLDDPDEQFAVAHDHETDCGGFANLRDVWTIAAEPLKEKHYAAFPTALVSNCLRAGTSARGYCRLCGAPWCRVVETSAAYEARKATLRSESDRWDTERRRQAEEIGNAFGGGPHGITPENKTLDWRPSCTCSDAGEPRPGCVLDPFAGSGRTGLEAQRLGLDFIGCELNPGYVEMSRRLLRGDMPLFHSDATPEADHD